MAEFKQYSRTGLSEMTPWLPTTNMKDVSVSQADKDNGSPKQGDMIARNPKSHKDLWLVAKQYFEDNLEEISTTQDFGWAINQIKQGKKISRRGWNGKGMFLYYVGANSYPVSGNPGSAVKGLYPDDMVPYSAYIAMKTVTGVIVPWLASQTDVLSEDWGVV